MAELTTPVELAERVAQIAASLGIETVLIGAYALAAYDYVRGTSDIDLGVHVQLETLRQLRDRLEAEGLITSLTMPDDNDALGGVVRVWERSDEEGRPIDPVEVVNFYNPYRPRPTPALDAIKNANSLAEKPALRYPPLADLIALKLYANSLRDDADVVELLVRHADSDVTEIRTTCERYGFHRIDELIARALSEKSKPA